MWIESHQALRGHLKVMQAAERLGINGPQMVGHLHYLWWWAYDNTPDGDLGSIKSVFIARAAGWEGDPEEFVSSLLECRGTGQNGFLERSENGGLRIHDWDQYGLKHISQKQKAAERQRRRRQSSDARDVTDLSRERTRDVRVTSPARHADEAIAPDLTGPDRTRPSNPVLGTLPLAREKRGPGTDKPRVTPLQPQEPDLGAKLASMISGRAPPE